MSRLTLFPHGPSSPETQIKLRELLFHCEADLNRWLDATPTSQDRFVKSTLLLDDISKPTISAPPPIIVLTQTTMYYANLVAARQSLTNKIPIFAKALWVIFVDSKQDPFFTQNASERGCFNDALDRAPILTDAPTSLCYLVLTPKTETGLVKNRATMLETVQAELMEIRARRERSSTVGRSITSSRRGTQP